jgi:hypothetical protein
MYLMPMFQEKFEAIRVAWVRPAWVIPVFLFVAISVEAQNGDGAGTAHMPGIALIPAARPGGLAGAYAANGTGTTAIGINPAGLAREPGRVFSGSVRPDMTRTGAVAYAFPATGGRWAVSATYVDYDAIIATDENQVGQGILRPYSLYPALTYAQTLGTGFYWGGTLKLARESLGDFEGSTPAYGAGFDAGVQYRPSNRGFGWGASVTNIGKQLSGHFEGDEGRGSLPGAARVGVSFDPRSKRELTLVADVETPFQGVPVLALGGEYRVLPEWILRAGTRWSADDLRNLSAWVDPNVTRDEHGGEAVKLAAGTTLRIRTFAVDYAAQWWKELGVVHALSVAWSLDP